MMAYDYPTEKISVYVSDDGGSAFTLFAFMEAARFAAHWLPYCRDNDIATRSPDEHFATNYWRNSESEKIKVMTTMWLSDGSHASLGVEESARVSHASGWTVRISLLVAAESLGLRF
ncbi:hypothetical protein F3Y22_tig00005465pilonHSYRG00040 [Hibiscus syriacus]|uniref:Uncharacterized protein n=1 Tax=Hibiscus syriacus TaxID=106335 RepID=A0A6A3CJ55_HIBSY|nr:hypothetical protein F3Y22_tig00005465pilonHSYRG00040 [Hibiscus syriacus]